MFSDFDLLLGAFEFPTTPTIVTTNNNGNNASVGLMQPKLEPQPAVFETKMVPIAPRYDFPQPSTSSNAYTCSHCSQPILERMLLYTQDRLSRGNFWHMQCLRCQCCDVVLAEVSSTFYTKDNALLCKSDYIKRYGSRPCSLCNQIIGTNEPIMRLSPTHVYHVTCFTCMKCHVPLVRGDRYVVHNGQPFCEKDSPLKTTTVPKRGATTSKRGAKSARGAAHQVQQTFGPPPPSTSYHPTGHISLLTNAHHLHGLHSNTMTHSLLNNHHHLNTNDSLSSGNELY